MALAGPSLGEGGGRGRDRRSQPRASGRAQPGSARRQLEALAGSSIPADLDFAERMKHVADYPLGASG